MAFLRARFRGVFVLQGFDSRISTRYLLIGIISAICSGIAYNPVRRLCEREDPIVVVLHFQLVGIAAGLVFTFFSWRTPLPTEWFCLLMCGVLTQVGQLCLTKSLQSERIQQQADPAARLCHQARRRTSPSCGGHGNPRLRAALVEAAWRLVRFQPQYRAVVKWRQVLAKGALATGAARKKAIVAVARQLAVDLWRLRTGQLTPKSSGLFERKKGHAFEGNSSLTQGGSLTNEITLKRQSRRFGTCGAPAT